MVELTEKEKEKWKILKKYMRRVSDKTLFISWDFESFIEDIINGNIDDYENSEYKTAFAMLSPDLRERIISYMKENNKEVRLSNIDGLIRDIKKWFSFDVFVIGCGGVGGYFAWVSAKGEFPINRLFLIDDDIVERKNVTRQVFRSCDVGKPKVEALKEIVEESNNNIKVFPINSKAEGDVLEFVKSIISNNPFSFVVIATDTLKSKKEIFQYLSKDNDFKNIFIVNNDRDEIEIENKLSDEDVAYWGNDNGYQTNQNFLANIMSAFAIWVNIGFYRTETNYILKDLVTLRERIEYINAGVETEEIINKKLKEVL